jgi:hypothetical protein
VSLYRYDGECQPYLGRRQQAPWEPGWSRFDKKRARRTSSVSVLGWTYANEHLRVHITVCESHHDSPHVSRRERSVDAQAQCQRPGAGCRCQDWREALSAKTGAWRIVNHGE